MKHGREREAGRPLPSACCGFTLVETLVVCGILATLAGLAVLSATGPFPWARPEEAAVHQAEAAGRWLESAFEKGLLEQAAFSLKLPGTPSGKLVLTWQGQGFTESEIYDSRRECDFVVKGGNSATVAYNPSYHSVSPAFTLNVLPAGGRVPVRQVIVSAYARIRVKVP